MTIRNIACLLALTIAACTAAPPGETAPSPCSPSLAGDIFAREGVEGVFVLLDETSGCVRTTDSAMADQGFRPQSTFKIANTLIGLETGVIEGEHHQWPWDGTPRPLPRWEQDLDLAGALRVSCVPCYQDVARRVGRERMARYLRDFDYGNEDISGPIDLFWLTGQLRITPCEQVDFVRRMLTGELPVSMENIALVWRLLEIERGDGYVWYGKTGSGAQDGRAIGWLVGYVERDGRRWMYATFVRSRSEATEVEFARLLPLRTSISRAFLTGEGLIPTAPPE